ncbi:hypothetical protein QUB02_11015 [Microcoleus sp. D3_18_C1]
MSVIKYLPSCSCFLGAQCRILLCYGVWIQEIVADEPCFDNWRTKIDEEYFGG